MPLAQVCVDHYTSLGYAEVRQDEAATATAFFHRALVCSASLRVEVERVMTDNGGG